MTAVSAPVAARTARVLLPPPGRLGALLAVLTLPAWIAAFLTLTAGFGVKSDEQATFTPAQQAAEYQGNTGGSWAFGIVTVVAILLLAIAPAVLAVAVARLRRLRVAAAVVVLLCAVGLVLEGIVEASYFGLLASPPDALPGWVETLAGPDANTVLNAVGWAAIDVAVPLAALLLSRVRALPRMGLVVAIIGGVIAVAGAALLFFQPMVPAVLLLVLGVPLLRRRK